MGALQGRKLYGDLKTFLSSQHLSLESVLTVVKEEKWPHPLVESVVSRDDWNKLSFDEKVSVAEESGWKYPFIKPLFSRKDSTLEEMILEEMIEVMKRSNWNDVVVRIFISTKIWIDLPLEEAIEVALENNLHPILIESIIKREDFK